MTSHSSWTLPITCSISPTAMNKSRSKCGKLLWDAIYKAKSYQLNEKPNVFDWLSHDRGKRLSASSLLYMFRWFPMGTVSLCKNEFVCSNSVSIVGSLVLQWFCACEKTGPGRVCAKWKNRVGDGQVHKFVQVLRVTHTSLRGQLTYFPSDSR